MKRFAGIMLMLLGLGLIAVSGAAADDREVVQVIDHLGLKVTLPEGLVIVTPDQSSLVFDEAESRS